MKKRVFFFLLITCIYLHGCSSEGDGKQSRLALLKTMQPAPIEISYQNKEKSIGFQVRQDLKQIDEIYDVAVIEGEKKILVAYKVKHFHRFKMKKIEKKITEQLTNDYPKHEFIVSSDYKIFLEAIRLKEDLEDGNLSTHEAKKRFDKIIKLQKEMT